MFKHYINYNKQFILYKSHFFAIITFEFGARQMDSTEEKNSELLEQLDLLYKQKAFISENYNKVFEKYRNLGKEIKETYDLISQLSEKEKEYIDKTIGKLERKISTISDMLSLFVFGSSLFISLHWFSLTNVLNNYAFPKTALIFAFNGLATYGFYKFVRYLGDKRIEKENQELENDAEYLSLKEKKINLNNQILKLSQFEALMTSNLKVLDKSKRSVNLSIREIEKILDETGTHSLNSVTPKQDVKL